jgi:drug/metabolite transporter (DMT)-like permease
MVVGPWHYFFAHSAIASAARGELARQIMFQGVVFGCGVAFAINYAVLAVGSQTVGVLSALVPVVGALCAMWIAGDRISGLEWIAISAISCGVAVACLPSRGALSLALRGHASRSPLARGSPLDASTAARAAPGGD